MEGTHRDGQSMAINLCYDNLGINPDLGYPNLAAPNLAPDEFDTTWPLSIPIRLLLYFRQANIGFYSHTVNDAPIGSWYPVALGWHDHALDYFSLMSSQVLDRIRQKSIRVLFYYHEGDDPRTIKKIIDRHASMHDLPIGCYLFVSANTIAGQLDNFLYFNDHEHFFQYINRRQGSPLINCNKRPYQFTALNRTHKWWRAAVMSDLWRSNILSQSQWSYNTECVIYDNEKDNPLRIHEFEDWHRATIEFVSKGPYICDTLDADQHNDHRSVNTDLYQHSYCHLVLETHFDADGSGGSFLTEKTFKCLKYAQPFILIGPSGSLRLLRSQGYRVFDHALDNSYDMILNNTERWLATRKVIRDLQNKDMHQWFLSCVDDLEHNQRLFQSKQKVDLLRLAQDLDTV
jgi:hypothetical protein